MKDSERIQQLIDENERALIDLRLQLDAAKRAESIADQNSERRKQIMRRVLARLSEGWYVSVVGSRHWWISCAGALVEYATADEMEMIFVLKSKGVAEGVKNG